MNNKIGKINGIDKKINTISDKLLRLQDEYKVLDIAKREYSMFKDPKNEDQKKVYMNAKSIIDKIRHENGSFTNYLISLFDRIIALSNDLKDLYNQREELLNRS